AKMLRPTAAVRVHAGQKKAAGAAADRPVLPAAKDPLMPPARPTARCRRPCRSDEGVYAARARSEGGERRRPVAPASATSPSPKRATLTGSGTASGEAAASTGDAPFVVITRSQSPGWEAQMLTESVRPSGLKFTTSTLAVKSSRPRYWN